jgi:hypothetical protein
MVAHRLEGLRELCQFAVSLAVDRARLAVLRSAAWLRLPPQATPIRFLRASTTHKNRRLY